MIGTRDMTFDSIYDMAPNANRITLQRATIRLAASVVILTLTPIPLWIRVIIVLFIFDLIDGCNLYGEPASSPGSRCKTPFYQKVDKIVDLVLLLLIGFVILPNECLNIQKQRRTALLDQCVIDNDELIQSIDPFYIRLVQILVIYRAIGVLLFLFSGWELYLVIFANFAEFVIVLVTLGLTEPIIIALALIVKIIQEIYLHSGISIK